MNCEKCGSFYTNDVMDHFQNPRNAGYLIDADGEGKTGDPECGDHIVISIKVRNKKIEEIRFLVYGCAAAIASTSITTELAKGKPLDEALKITDEDVIEALGGLPENKLHCSLLGPTALKGAIQNYYDRINDYKKCLIYQE